MVSYLLASRPAMMPSHAVVTILPSTPIRLAISVPIEASKPTTSFLSLTKLNGGYCPVIAMVRAPADLTFSRSSALAGDAAKLAASRPTAASPERNLFMWLSSLPLEFRID